MCLALSTIAFSSPSSQKVAGGEGRGSAQRGRVYIGGAEIAMFLASHTCDLELRNSHFIAIGAESAAQEPEWDPGCFSPGQMWPRTVSDPALTGHSSPLPASCPEDTWGGPQDP